MKNILPRSAVLFTALPATAGLMYEPRQAANSSENQLRILRK